MKMSPDLPMKKREAKRFAVLTTRWHSLQTQIRAHEETIRESRAAIEQIQADIAHARFDLQSLYTARDELLDELRIWFWSFPPETNQSKKKEDALCNQN